MTISESYAELEPRRPGKDDDGLSLSEYLAILLDDWRILAVCFLLAIGLATLYLVLSVPMYSSSGVIQVSASNPSEASELLDLTVGRPSPVDTEVEILRSHQIIRKAFQSLSLNIYQELPAFSLDFGITLRGKSPLKKELVALREMIVDLAIADWHESPISATFGVDDEGITVQLRGKGRERVPYGGRYEKHGVSFSVKPGNGAVRGKSLDVALIPGDVSAERAAEHLTVTMIGGGRKDTNLVRVTYESPDRVVARNVVNAIMDAYQDFALDWRTLSANRSAAFIEKQLESIRVSLEVADKEMEAFIRENGAVYLPEQAKELITTGAQLDLEMRKADIQEDLLTMAVSGIRKAEKNGTASALTSDFLFEDELLAKAIGALNEMELKHETLLADVTQAHPEVLKLENEIRKVRDQTKKLVSASRQRIQKRQKAIDGTLGGIQEQLKEFPTKERQLAVLQRNQGVTQDLYKFLLTKLEEARLVKESTTTDKRIIDRATTPFHHSRPKRRTTWLLASFLGLFLGIGVIFARRAIDPRIRDEEEAKTLWGGVPLYGAVPDLNVLGVLTRNSSILESIWELPKGPAAEAFRTIRTNVEFTQVGEQPIKVIQITSSEASEGKSTIIANLAIALSKAGHRVLIVDLDLRRPSQHRMFRTRRIPGISDHLVGRGEVAIHTVEKYAVDFIPAGNEPPESQRLLASAGLEKLIRGWRERYDYILLDTPPLLVADSVVISRLSDMVIFVVRPRHCRREVLRLAKNAQQRMDQVKGLVINGVATRRGGYYHYYRGSYYGSKTTDTQET
jgi:capsular exopolysaccharide synthesis family protein